MSPCKRPKEAICALVMDLQRKAVRTSGGLLASAGRMINSDCMQIHHRAYSAPGARMKTLGKANDLTIYIISPWLLAACTTAKGLGNETLTTNKDKSHELINVILLTEIKSIILSFDVYNLIRIFEISRNPQFYILKTNFNL